MRQHHQSGARGSLARFLAVLVALSFAAAACGSTNAEAGDETTSSDIAVTVDDGVDYGASLDEWSEANGLSSASAYPDGYELLDWEDLVPPGFSGDAIMARYQDRLAELPDGSPEANAIYEEMQAEYDASVVNEDLDGSKINLAGFVAPLSYEGEIITEFLLVPYFGACIHVPPPPPNQTILVSVDRANGLTIDESYGAVWVAGTLDATSTTTDLATASYSLVGATTGVYDDF